MDQRLFGNRKRDETIILLAPLIESLDLSIDDEFRGSACQFGIRHALLHGSAQEGLCSNGHDQEVGKCPAAVLGLFDDVTNDRRENPEVEARLNRVELRPKPGNSHESHRQSVVGSGIHWRMGKKGVSWAAPGRVANRVVLSCAHFLPHRSASGQLEPPKSSPFRCNSRQGCFPIPADSFVRRGGSPDRASGRLDLGARRSGASHCRIAESLPP